MNRRTFLGSVLLSLFGVRRRTLDPDVVYEQRLRGVSASSIAHACGLRRAEVWRVLAEKCKKEERRLLTAYGILPRL